MLVQSSTDNLLLASMAADDFTQLAPFMEPVELPIQFHLVELDAPIDYVYFASSGVTSIITAADELQVEMGLFGREGFGPMPAVLGCELSPHTIFMQVAGTGHRIAREHLLSVLAERPAVRDLLLRFVHVMYTQAAYSALTNAVHQLDQRLARWLLMCHDRSIGDEMPLTHEWLSLMLGVRRPSVTTALHVLEGKHLIGMERGYITIRRREALEEFAAGAYGRPEQEYRRLIGPMR